MIFGDVDPVPNGTIGWILTAVLGPLVVLMGIIVKWQMKTITDQREDAKILAKDTLTTVKDMADKFALAATTMASYYTEASDKRNTIHQQTIDSIMTRHQKTVESLVAKHQEMQADYAEHCEKENLRVAMFFGWKEGGDGTKPK